MLMRHSLSPHSEFKQVSRPLQPGEQIPVLPTLLEQVVAYRRAASHVSRVADDAPEKNEELK